MQQQVSQAEALRPTNKFQNSAQNTAPLLQMSKSTSMLAGIEIIAPSALNLLSSSASHMQDLSIKELFQNTDKLIKDSQKQGLAYSSALWEDILGIRGTGSKRVEAPLEKRTDAKIKDKDTRDALKSIYMDAQEAYGFSTGAAKAQESQNAQDFAANVLNEAFNEGVVQNHTVSQFASNALGNIERKALGETVLAASIQTVSVSVEADAIFLPIEMEGYARINMPTAQALVYYFQEHPEEYDETIMEALGIKSIALSNSALIISKIKHEQKKHGKIAFTEKLFGIIAEKKKKQGVFDRFLSQFGFRVDKKSRTAMICEKIKPRRISTDVKGLKTMKN